MHMSVFDRKDQDNLDRKIAVGFDRITQVLKTLIWNESKRSGLSPIQIQFLIALAYDRDTQWTIGEIASRFQLTPATVSDALTALEGKGLIVRTRSEEDKRIVFVALTPEGIRTARTVGKWLNVVQEQIAELGGEEKAVLLRSLIRLIAAFQQEGMISTKGMCVFCTYFRPNVHRSATAPHHCAYIDKAFGDAELRIDCPDYEEKPAEA
jgi:DNA-binding MarR family transcriptional regulator